MASKGTRGKVIDLDHGWKAFKETVDRLAAERPDVVCGVMGAAAGAVHPSSKLGENVATIAAKNEYGLGVPERSFLRSTWDMNRDKYVNYLSRGISNEIQNVARTNKPIDSDSSVTIKRLALRMEGDVKRRIGKREIPPPNAKSTIARKKSDTPLIDTGHLRQALTSAVRKGGR